jgi:hypothetical protein
MVTCYHTVDVFKNTMILVGGTTIAEGSGVGREINAYISIFNFDKREWSKLRGNIGVRSHASTLFGTTLMIHGGIDEKEVHSNMMHFLNLNTGNVSSSILLST